MKPLWDALYEAGAEVVINVHDHVYERFSPRTLEGGRDPSRGIREFAVGTGGKSPYSLGDAKPNSETCSSESYSVIRFALKAGGLQVGVRTGGGGYVRRLGQRVVPLAVCSSRAV